MSFVTETHMDRRTPGFNGSGFDGRRSGRRFAGLRETVARLLSGAARIAKAVKNRRDAAQLYALTDRDLHDIGVTRNDVDREVMKPVVWS